MRIPRLLLTVLGGLALAASASAFAGEAPKDPSKVAALRGEAQAAYAQKNYVRSAELYAAAFAEGLDKAGDYYDAACAAALAGQRDTAFRHLEAAVAGGYSNDKHLSADEDLTGLHADPRWQKVVDGVKANLEKKLAAVGNRPLREEILHMRDVDQAARAKLQGQIDQPDPAVVKEVDEVDARNRARMKEIVAQHGWPGKSLVGEDGAAAAWLLVQHADREPDFQMRCLELLAEAVKKGEASGANLAYLTDRVLVAQKKPQRYGTQARREGERFVPQPLENEAEVDRLRAEVGLAPLAEYLKQMEQFYAPRKEPEARPAPQAP